MVIYLLLYGYIKIAADMTASALIGNRQLTLGGILLGCFRFWVILESGCGTSKSKAGNLRSRLALALVSQFNCQLILQMILHYEDILWFETSFKMGSFSDPWHIHLDILCWSTPPPPWGQLGTNLAPGSSTLRECSTLSEPWEKIPGIKMNQSLLKPCVYMTNQALSAVEKYR